jgi:hypothetical protein
VRSSNNLIQGNLIGLKADGATANGNGYGIYVTSGLDDNGAPAVTENNVIGSSDASGRNIISGNQIAGIRITDGVSGTLIHGNYIGTSEDGTLRVSNLDGIFSSGYLGTIGGATIGDRNVISGNTNDGIHLDYNATGNVPATTGIEIIGNYIGVNASNSVGMGNGRCGVETFSFANTIGETGGTKANIIASNVADGVLLHGTNPLGNTVRNNVMHDNGGLGIDLMAGNSEPGDVTPNDANDADGLQNFPVLTSATIAKAKNTYLVNGSLQAMPNESYSIDFYVSTVPSASGHGEARVYCGGVQFKADKNGLIPFAQSLPIPAAGQPGTGKVLCATATHVVFTGAKKVATVTATSEFSNNITLP